MKNLITAFLPLIGLILIVGIGAAVIAALKQRLRGKQPTPYEKEDALLTPAERSFFGVLESAFGAQFRLFAKVRLADVVTVKRGMDRSSWQSAFNALQSKHIDFLACDPHDMAIRFVVELDDRSHERQHRKERDYFVDRALAAAGVPIFRFTVKRGYSVQEIRRTILEEEKKVDQAGAPSSQPSARAKKQWTL
jgi:Protein of unknown function (DUF2726)